jgi:prolyl-tRNA synthetase
MPIVADECLRDGIYLAGANRDGFHVKGVRPGVDFTARFADLHVVRSGEGCSPCGAELAVEPVIEVGNIFKLGTKYSVPLRAVFLDEHGQERPIVMGSYGIGPARIAAAAVEQSHDADGIIWPWSIAPYQIHIVPVNMKDQAQAGTAEALYAELLEAGYEVLLDDRDERPGVKFKDADLIGIPIRVTVGTAFVKDGAVEVRLRRRREDWRVPPRELLATVRELAGELNRA